MLANPIMALKSAANIAEKEGYIPIILSDRRITIYSTTNGTNDAKSYDDATKSTSNADATTSSTANTNY